MSSTNVLQRLFEFYEDGLVYRHSFLGSLTGSASPKVGDILHKPLEKGKELSAASDMAVRIYDIQDSEVTFSKLPMIPFDFTLLQVLSGPDLEVDESIDKEKHTGSIYKLENDPSTGTFMKTEYKILKNGNKKHLVDSVFQQTNHPKHFMFIVHAFSAPNQYLRGIVYNEQSARVTTSMTDLKKLLGGSKMKIVANVSRLQK